MIACARSMSAGSSASRLRSIGASVSITRRTVSSTLDPAAAAAQDGQDKPVTVKQVAKNVGNETKRVYKRSEKTVRKDYDVIEGSHRITITTDQAF